MLLLLRKEIERSHQYHEYYKCWYKKYITVHCATKNSFTTRLQWDKTVGWQTSWFLIDAWICFMICANLVQLKTKSYDPHNLLLLIVPKTARVWIWESITLDLQVLKRKRKRKRSDSVLWQKPLHKQKCQNTTQTTPQKSSITQRSPTDSGRSVGVTTATQLVWLTWF